MNDSQPPRWLLFALSFIAAIAFLAGIRWGLPSTATDKYLTASLAQNGDVSADSQIRSGAGILHWTATDWSNDRPADVAAHPILDRSAPVILLDNTHPLKPGQIHDDPSIVSLYAAEQQGSRQTMRPGLTPDQRADALESLSHSQQVLQNAVDAYNQARTPGIAQIVAQDRIARAKIMLRYRLYSEQPDEMQTFRALALMRPGQFNFDPHLYQYGGLWVYPIGAALGFAGKVGLVSLDHNIAHYLDLPEDFAPFYVIARGYSAAWGIAAMLAIFLLARRMTGGLLLPTLAALTFIALPVVLDQAHEAKPHLAGAALLLFAILAADQGKRWTTAILCGLAASMVLWAAVGLLLIPIARRSWSSALDILLAIAIYFLLNPYVLIDHHAFAANFSNTRDMYHLGSIFQSIAGIPRLLALGASWPIGLAGLAGLVVLLRRPSRLTIMLALLALITILPVAFVGQNKPAEHARFALPAVAVLLLAAVGGIQSLRPTLHAPLAVLLLISACTYSAAYEYGFLSDQSRTLAAEQIESISRQHPNQTPILAVDEEPAPYRLPPVDLFSWRIVLLPRGGVMNPKPTLTVTPDDLINIWDPRQTPISWANKTFKLE